jgi:hypothetical protein
MLMRGALDDRLVAGFVQGRYYGVVDSEVKPLFGLVAATFARYRSTPDGGYEGIGYEIAYFTDPDTGRVMDSWHNPYTDEQVTVPETASQPTRTVITPALEVTIPKASPGLDFQTRVHPPQLAEDDVWIAEETLVAFQPPGAPKPARYTEFLTMHARRTDLETAGTKRVPCQTSYASVVSWRPWLKMGDHPGHLMANGSGRYDAPMSALPEAWREATRARRPETLTDPAKPIAAVWNG